jgi:hypothetical protein
MGDRDIRELEYMLEELTNEVTESTTTATITTATPGAIASTTTNFSAIVPPPEEATTALKQGAPERDEIEQLYHEYINLIENKDESTTATTADAASATASDSNVSVTVSLEGDETEQLFQEYKRLIANIDDTNSNDSILRELWHLHEKILLLKGCTGNRRRIKAAILNFKIFQT